MIILFSNLISLQIPLYNQQDNALFLFPADVDKDEISTAVNDVAHSSTNSDDITYDGEPFL